MHHLGRELTRLSESVQSLGREVESAVGKSIEAFLNRDPALAEEVIRGDEVIDAKEIEVEEECLKILALHQPVATDLRYVIAVLKLNNDLERMGDIAVNIARRGRYLQRKNAQIELPEFFEEMVGLVRGMVRDAIQALIASDTQLAERVRLTDDAVDARKRQIMRRIRALIQDRPQDASVLLKILDVPRHLERLGDLATNIAEDVIYFAEGKIVRHRDLDTDPDEENAAE